MNADRRAGRRVDEAGAVAEVHVDVAREDVRRADRVRAVRRDRMFASTNVLTASGRCSARRRSSVSVTRAAADAERRGRVPGHLARRVRGERDRALARRVRVRAGVGAGARSEPCARRRASRSASRRRARPDRRRSPRRCPVSTVTVNVCGWPTPFVGVRRDRDPRLDPRLRRGAGVAARAVRVTRQRDAGDASPSSAR